MQLIQVQQNPRDLVLHKGASLKVSCSLTVTSSPNLYWYHWNETKGFTLVFTSVTIGSVTPVSEGMELILVQQDTRDLVLYKGSSLKVSCSVTGMSTVNPYLYWYHWNETTGFTLVFTSTTTGSVNPFSEGMQLIQVQQDTRDLVLYKGSSLKVSCSVTGMSSPNLYWYHWNETTGFTLVFTSVATGSVNPDSEGMELILVQQDTRDLVLYKGSSLKVSCSVTGMSTVNPYLYWYHWNETTGFTLVFTSTTTGSVNPFSEGMQLIQVQQDTRDLVLYKGSSLKVSCSVTGMSSPNLYWYHWNETTGFTLVFTSVATGSVNPDSEGMQLIQVQQDTRDLVLYKGSSLKVSCSVTGMSSPNLYWYHWNETTGFTLVFTSFATGSVNPDSKGLDLIQVHQDPQDLVLSEGSSLKVSCSISGINDPYLYWYCWTPAEGFTMVFYSISAGLVSPSSEGQFKSQRPDGIHIVLESDGMSKNGSSVWYCAASPHSIPVSS
ncbi:hypothetical protein QTP86_003372 [Hemibagrus guttatus]|nr:hypothetical protein QTP86_003372 [Hemibagrus guttatus]